MTTVYRILAINAYIDAMTEVELRHVEDRIACRRSEITCHHCNGTDILPGPDGTVLPCDHTWAGEATKAGTLRKPWGVLAIAFLAVCLTACGRDNSQAGTTTTPALEVTKLTATSSCLTSCTVTVSADFNDGAAHSVVANITAGTTAAATCTSDANEGLAIQFTNLKPSTTYAVRGCRFDGTNYSPGLTTTVTTGTLIK